MKKFVFIALAMVTGAGMLLNSCKKESDDNSGNVTPTPTVDVVKPVIHINGHNPDTVVQFSVVSYTDQGATATDDVSGSLTVTKSGSVNMSSAGDYTINYSATDAAGNKGEATRNIIVDGGLFLAGTYIAEDFTGSSSNGTYPETISASTLYKNRIIFAHFAYYTNAVVYGIITGTSITIPQQTVSCGNPPASRSFQGSGSYINNFTNFTVNYTEVTGGTTVVGHGTYTRN